MQFWPAIDVLGIPENDTHPLPQEIQNAWLLRQGVVIHQPSPISNVTEAQLTLYLRPHNHDDMTSAYAHSLFPSQSQQNGNSSTIILNSDLNFSDLVDPYPHKTHNTITTHQTYPIIQSYGIGECAPYWIFKPQGPQALEGTQFVYAIIVTQNTPVDVIVELIVTVNTRRGEMRFGLPSKARTHVRFNIPQQEVYHAEKARS
jgi:hypothetical protein